MMKPKSKYYSQHCPKNVRNSSALVRESSMRKTPWKRDDLKSQLKMRIKTIEHYSNIDFIEK